MPWEISFWAAWEPVDAWHASSCETIWIFLPFTPPLALMSLAASWAPCRISVPALAYSPDRGTGTPMRIAPWLLWPPDEPELAEELQAAVVSATAAKITVAAVFEPTSFIAPAPSSQAPLIRLLLST